MNKIIFESGNSFPVADGFRLELMRGEIKKIRDRNSKLHQFDYDYKLDECLNEVLDLLSEYLDFDPTPQFLYDDTGGEPPVSSAERCQASYRQKRELHS